MNNAAVDAGPRVRTDRARLLELLDSRSEDPPTMDDLRERGVPMPGQAIYELELDGYSIERVGRRDGGRTHGGVGYRLRPPRR